MLKMLACKKMAKLSLLPGYLAFLACVAQAADLTWTGAASSVWDTQTANWQNENGIACVWADGNQAVFTTDSSVTEITVSGEVKPTSLKFTAGAWSFGGSGTVRITDGLLGQASTDPTVGVTFKGGLTVRADRTVDMNLANLTIEHASFLCPTNIFRNNYDGSVFSAQAQGIITIGDGGNLSATNLVLSFATDAAKQANYAVNIFTNGVLNLTAGLDSSFQTKYGTIHSDGGEIQGGAFMSGASSTTKFSLGPGGVRFTGSKAQYLNVPIEGSGSLVLDNTGYTYFHPSGSAASVPSSTYTGGTRFLKNLVTIFTHDRNFGAVPAVATGNMFIDASSTLLAQSAMVEFAPTRGFVLAADAKLSICGNNVWMKIKGPITGTNHYAAANGTVSTDVSSWKPKGLAIEPAAGVTNRFGRLFVKTRDLIIGGEGATEVNAKITAAENDAAILAIKGAMLSVTNGLFSVTNGSYISNCGHLMVSGGVADFSGIKNDYLNAFRYPGTTTVCRAGTMICNNFRMGEGISSKVPESALLRLQTGGTLMCNSFAMSTTKNQAGDVTDLTAAAQIDWDGGILAPRKATLNLLGGAGVTGQTEAWINRVKVYVREGGAVVSNNYDNYIRVPLRHGVADGDADGGFTKWGTGEMRFVGVPDAVTGSFNTFNGPVNVEQGTLTLGSASNFLATTRLYVRSGATFDGNSTNQTFAVLGGTGTVRNPSKLTLADAFTPGYGADGIGTLTIAAALGEVKDGVEMQIDLDAEGRSDCLSYAASLDLSKLRLVINNPGRLNRRYRYTIATNLTSCANEFASSNLSSTWRVKKVTSGGKVSLYLLPVKGAVIGFR